MTTKMLRDIFSERLSDIMSDRGLTAKALADLSGLSKYTIDNYRSLSGHSELPNGTTLYLLADALDVSIDYLLGRTD